MNGIEVKEQRLKERIPQAVLARYADLSGPELSRFENGKGELKPEEIGNLAKGLIVIPLMAYRDVMKLASEVETDEEELLLTRLPDATLAGVG